jgi:hypothetical protein
MSAMSAMSADLPTTILDLNRDMQEKILNLLPVKDQTSFSEGTYTKHYHIEEHQRTNATETIVIAELLRWALHIFLKDKTVQKGAFDIDFGLSSGNSIEDDPHEEETWKESLHFTFTYKPAEFSSVKPSDTIEISFWAFVPEYPTKQKIDGTKIGPPYKWFPTYVMRDKLIADSQKLDLKITATYKGEQVTGIKGLDQIFNLKFNPPHYEEWSAVYKNVSGLEPVHRAGRILGAVPRYLDTHRTIPFIHDLASQLNITHDMYTQGLADTPLLVYQPTFTRQVVDVVAPPTVNVVAPPINQIPKGLFQSTFFKKNVLNYSASINLVRKGKSVPRNVSNACVIFLLHIYNQVESFAVNNKYRPKYKDLTKLTVTPLPKDKYKHLEGLIANNKTGLLLSSCTFLYNFSNDSDVLVINNNDKTLFWLEEPKEQSQQQQGGGKLKKPSNGKIHVRKEPIQGYNRAIYKLVGKGNTLFVDIKGICKRYTDVK